MRIIQMLSTIAYGDAVSNDTIAMEKIIKEMGYDTKIYAESIVPPLDNKTAVSVDKLTDVHQDDIIIFHMSTGSKLNYDVAKYNCRKIVVYHNITPPEYFRNCDERFTKICEYGLEGAKYLADKVDYWLGDVWKGLQPEKLEALHKINEIPVTGCGDCTFKQNCSSQVCKLINKAYTGDYYTVSAFQCNERDIVYRIYKKYKYILEGFHV